MPNSKKLLSLHGCASANAILDLALTLEALDTVGVPIIGFETATFPAIYSMSSGLPVDKRLNNTTDIARVMATKWGLGLEGAVLVATPVPEQSAMDAAHIESIIKQAVVEAHHAQIIGKDLTPYLLRKIVAQSGRQSIEANTALVEHNTQVGGAIAVAFAVP